MNQADILKLAEEAGFECSVGNRKIVTVWAINQCRFDGNCNADVTQELTRFAELVAQHEITEILEMVDDLPELNASNYNHDDVCDLNSKVCNLVLAIRARETK